MALPKFGRPATVKSPAKQPDAPTIRRVPGQKAK